LAASRSTAGKNFYSFYKMSNERGDSEEICASIEHLKKETVEKIRNVKVLLLLKVYPLLQAAPVQEAPPLREETAQKNSPMHGMRESCDSKEGGVW
jgi:hypothetical protein